MAIVWETIRDGVRSNDGRFCVFYSQGYVRVGCHWWLIDRATDCQEWSFETAEMAKAQAQAILDKEQLADLWISPEGIQECLNWMPSEESARETRDLLPDASDELNRDTIRDKVTRFEANNALMKEK